MTEDQKALVDRLKNPEWSVVNATYNTPKVRDDMLAAAKLIRELAGE